MKHYFISGILILLVGLGIYFDLSHGTLREQQVQSVQKQDIPQIPYQEVTVQAGYTVLSIVEHLHEGQLPTTIDQIIIDFKQLNPNIEPEDIQIGKTYLFPLYGEMAELE